MHNIRSEHLPQQINERENRRIDALRSVAATVLASALATGLFHPTVASLEVPNPFAETTEVSANPSQQTATSTEHKTDDNPAAERWAKLFSSDKEAGELTTPSELTKVEAAIQSLHDRGYSVDSITLRGHSSDEDDTRDSSGRRTGGLGVKSTDNAALGDKRATIFNELLTQDMAAKGTPIPVTSVEAPLEDLLPPAEIHDISVLAQKYGYKTTVSMIEQYNRTGATPPEVTKLLDATLKSHRFVEVHIEASKQIPGSAAPETTVKHHHGKIPINIPLIVLVPILIRRRVTDSFPRPVPPLRITPTDIVPVRPTLPNYVKTVSVPPAAEITEVEHPAKVFVPRQRRDGEYKTGKHGQSTVGNRDVAYHHKQPRDFSGSQRGPQGYKTHIARDHGGSRGRG